MRKRYWRQFITITIVLSILMPFFAPLTAEASEYDKDDILSMQESFEGEDSSMQEKLKDDTSYLEDIELDAIFTTEDEFRESIRQPKARISLFGADLLSDNGNSPAAAVAESGLYKSQFTDLEQVIYEGIENGDISCDNPFVYVNAPSAYNDWNYWTEKVTNSSGQVVTAIRKEAATRVYSAMYGYLRDNQRTMAWATNTIGISCGYSNGKVSVKVIFEVSPYYNAGIQAQIDDVVQGILQNVPNDRYDRVKYFHDWIINNNGYDTPTSKIANDDGSLLFYYAHSQIGCLIKGKGVCESYAKAFKVLCEKSDIPCVIVSSSDHAWNYVKMEDDKWYMVDCTFDDPTDSNGNDQNALRYTYFLVSNNPNISKHYEDTILVYPKTSTTKYVKTESAKHSIIYHTYNAGNGNNPAEYKEGSSSLVLNNPVKDGFVFEGWYDNRDFEGDAISTLSLVNKKEDIYLWAKWRPIDAKIPYGVCGDDLEWIIDDDTLQISGSGAMDDYYQYAPWYDYKDAYSQVVISENVSSIGMHAFYDCKNISDIYILGYNTKITDTEGLKYPNEKGLGIWLDCNVFIYCGSALEKWALDNKATNFVFMDAIDDISESILDGGTSGIRFYYGIGDITNDIFYNSKLIVKKNGENLLEYDYLDELLDYDGEVPSLIFDAMFPVKDMDAKITVDLVYGADKETYTPGIRWYPLTEVTLYDILADYDKYYGGDYYTKLRGLGLYAEVMFGEKTASDADRLLEDCMSDSDIQSYKNSLDNVSSTTVQKYSKIVTDNTEGIDYIGTSLILKDYTIIRHYFRVDNDIDVNSLDVTVEGQETMLFNVSDDIYAVEINRIPGVTYDEQYTVKVEDIQIDYSVYSYIYDVLKGSASQDFATLVKAMYLYGESAKQKWMLN